MENLNERTQRELQRIQRWRGQRALFFDTETTGLPRRGRDLKAQPWVVQLAFTFGQIPETRGRPFQSEARVSLLIDLPTGVRVDAGAAEVHGIDDARIARYGVSRESAIQLFAQYMGMADVCIGHNVGFDFDRIWDEYRRSELFGDTVRDTHNHVERECTMRLSTDICALPPTAKMIRAGRNHFKNPNLGEACQVILGRELVGAHDALVDVDASADVFMALLDRGADLAGCAGFHKSVAPRDTEELPVADAEELL